MAKWFNGISLHMVAVCKISLHRNNACSISFLFDKPQYKEAAFFVLAVALGLVFFVFVLADE